MIKNKLFRKLIGIVCSVFITCLSGMNNNFVGAENSRTIVNGFFKGLPEREQSRLKKSLGFSNHQELCFKIRDKFGVETFAEHKKAYKDNVRFVCFIKFIAGSRLSRKEKDELISKAFEMRFEEELENDKRIIAIYPEIMGEFMREIFGMPPLEIEED